MDVGTGYYCHAGVPLALFHLFVTHTTRCLTDYCLEVVVAYYVGYLIARRMMPPERRGERILIQAEVITPARYHDEGILATRS